MEFSVYFHFLFLFFVFKMNPKRKDKSLRQKKNTRICALLKVHRQMSRVRPKERSPSLFSPYTQKIPNSRHSHKQKEKAQLAVN